MPGLVLDVIMGMNWMKEWDAVIDTGKRGYLSENPRAVDLFKCLCPVALTLLASLVLRTWFRYRRSQ